MIGALVESLESVGLPTQEVPGKRARMNACSNSASLPASPRSIGHFLLHDLRFLAKLRRRKALPANILLHVDAAAIGRRR